MKTKLTHATPIKTGSRAALLFAGLIVAGASHAQSYQFVDLGSNSYADGINDANAVVGAIGNNPAVWSNGTSTLLYQGSTFDSAGVASAINNQGEIVGWVNYHGSSTGFAWNPSTYTSNFTALLGPTNLSTIPVAINNSGAIAGGAGGGGAVVWGNSGTSATVLSYNGPTGATAINNSGAVAGYEYSDNTGASLAVVWKNGTTTYLNTPAGNGSAADGINDEGVVVGSLGTLSNGTITKNTAVEWKNGSVISLGGLGGNVSVANAISNSGLVVGYSTNSAGADIATMWRGTTAINLNSELTPAELAAGWTLTDASAVNNNGWIVGEATNSKTGATDGFILEVSPVPEPETWAMLLGGAGLIAATILRKKMNRVDATGMAGLGMA